MNIGIVGHGEDKFTAETERKARYIIKELLSVPVSVLISGRSPVGGIDIWAEEIADNLRIQKIIHAPQVNQWNPPGQYGYKARNIDIAKDSDVVNNIVVKEYPPGYTGRRFTYCYHCNDNDHVKSGGCWTAHKAKTLGKEAVWHII